jgi:hypothetical protein
MRERRRARVPRVLVRSGDRIAGATGPSGRRPRNGAAGGWLLVAVIGGIALAAGPARAAEGWPPTAGQDPGTAAADPEAVAREARAILARFRHEPSVLEVQRAAVRHAGIDAARLDSWRRRSRWAAAAPELLAEYRRAAATDRTLGAQASGTVDYADLDLEDRYTARARWDLDRLVFSPDELRVAAETIEVVGLRQAVIDQVTRLYFERRRQQVLLLRSALGVEERLRLELRVEELTASLDGLTGGWFSARLHGSAGGDGGGRWEGAGGGWDRRSAHPGANRPTAFEDRTDLPEPGGRQRDVRDAGTFGPAGDPWLAGRGEGRER